MKTPICSLCPGIALRYAHGKFFCRLHLKEAWEAARKGLSHWKASQPFRNDYE